MEVIHKAVTLQTTSDLQFLRITEITGRSFS